MNVGNAEGDLVRVVGVNGKVAERLKAAGC